MSELRTIALLLAFLGPALGCSSPHTALRGVGSPTGKKHMPDTVTLTVAEANTPRAVTVGQEVLLHLEENPTTGYRWSLAAEPAGAVEVLDSPYQPGASAPGASGQREFHLRVRSPGTIHLHLKLWREWAGEGSAVERREFVLQAS